MRVMLLSYSCVTMAQLLCDNLQTNASRNKCARMGIPKTVKRDWRDDFCGIMAQTPQPKINHLRLEAISEPPRADRRANHIDIS